MSRSVSAPSSVTNTSPCWNGLMVPGSTLMYGSSFTTATFMPRHFRSLPNDAAVTPLPSDDTTPPVMNTYRVRDSIRRYLPRGLPRVQDGIGPGYGIRAITLAGAPEASWMRAAPATIQAPVGGS